MNEPVITYTWRIERLDCVPAQGSLTNVARRIHWRLLATDGERSADAYGEIGLAPPDPESFVPYPELEETTVIDWLEGAINARSTQEESDQPSVAQMRTGLAGVLAAMRMPAAVAMALPWE
jgi:hypothetical protein